MRLFIDDGYNLPFYLRGEPGLHDELRGVYRPALHEERTDFWCWEARHEALQLEAAREAARGEKPTFTLEPGAKTARRAELLAGHLVSWETPRPTTAPHVRRLHPNLIDRLTRVILGVDPSDEDPRPPALEADGKNS